MDVKKTKETHPQWYYLKIICKLIYYVGIGDCWYEETKRSRTHKVLYAIWAVLINGYIILETCNEVLANFRTDLTIKEKNDLMQFTFAHPLLSAKYICLILQRKRVRVLFKRMVGEEWLYVCLDIEKKSVKKAMLYSLTLAAVTYTTLFFTALDALRGTIREGIPFRTEVHLFPSPSYSGIFFGFLYVLKECHWWVIVTNMILVDGLSIFSLVYLGSKCELVCKYFDSLREKTIKNSKSMSKETLGQEFEKDFINGIKLHEDTLWCARNVQYSLGNIYGAAVVETTSLLVFCLVKLVSAERNLTFLIANLTYIFCVLMVNGAYMMVAGDITYEISKLPMSMFYCGWELVPWRPGLRSLIVVALQCSQKPIYMTAFGVITLSYSNFISVIRAAYSFFAVFR
ncbi:uncharacterized protein LOC135079512 [Ostrinia nubilalis]|uniref:uncharacterized protein LOC135079512 n=1 Tax=Ostrinia nubilalis TaxID=29057 RepID=UPI0030822C49